jgi:putative two-component system response regulator
VPSVNNRIFHLSSRPVTSHIRWTFFLTLPTRMIKSEPARTRPYRSRGVLFSSLALLIPVGGTFLLPEAWTEAGGILWLLGLVPVYQLAYRDGWRGAATGMAGTIALLLLVHLVASPTGRGAPGSLAWVLPVFLATGAAMGWLSHRLRSEGGRAGGEPLTDPVTGLPSQQHARLLLESEFWSAERGRLVTVILFELDALHEYAQTRGQEAERVALEAFGQILRSTTRKMNLSARWTSTGFLSLLDGTDEDGAAIFAERVREAFASTPAGEAGLRVRAGIAGYHPSMADPDDLLAAAGLALERTRQGGGGVRIFGRPASSASPRDGMLVPSADHLPGLGSPTSGPNRGSTEPSGRLALNGEGRRILLVERDTSTRTLMSTHLQKRGFSVSELLDGSEAVKALGREFDLVIADLQLEDLPGQHLVSVVKARWPRTPVVAIAGFRDAQLAAEALTAGADRYLFRPFGMAELEAHLQDLLVQRRNRETRRDRERASGEARGGDDKAMGEILQGLRTLAAAVELRDPYTQGHAERVGKYTLALAGELEGLEWSEETRARVKLACDLHDIGKLAVPYHVLNKEGSLSDEEYARVREHPAAGRTLLEPLMQDDDLVLSITSWHHERWDGKGYPDGLAGQAIPLPARLVAIADSLDAMTSPRAYRAGLEWDDAVGQIRARAGTQFDPGLLPAFESALPSLKAIHDPEQE